MNCACAYYDTAERNLILILLRTALGPYWQSLVHLNCACVYYNTLLLHKIEKIKMAGSIREMSIEMGDNHGNFDLFKLDSSARIKIRICAKSCKLLESYRNVWSATIESCTLTALKLVSVQPCGEISWRWPASYQTVCSPALALTIKPGLGLARTVTLLCQTWARPELPE